MCRKGATLVSQIFTLIGAGCSAACVSAKAPELLMIGRVFVGINSGQLPLNARSFLSFIEHVASLQRDS